jgi:hypothetical protein
MLLPKSMVVSATLISLLRYLLVCIPVTLIFCHAKNISNHLPVCFISNWLAAGCQPFCLSSHIPCLLISLFISLSISCQYLLLLLCCYCYCYRYYCYCFYCICSTYIHLNFLVALQMQIHRALLHSSLSRCLPVCYCAVRITESTAFSQCASN